jgi:hypothetical protein
VSKAYRVLVGLNYPPDRRVEPGTVVTNLPEPSLKWLLAQGYVEPVADQAAPPKATPPTPTVASNPAAGEEDAEDGEDIPDRPIREAY